MRSEYVTLKKAYVSELRETRQMVEKWWQEMNPDFERNSSEAELHDLWPMGPASHPWVIAVFRKYYFLCDELNRQIMVMERPEIAGDEFPEELKWGVEKSMDQKSAPVDPKVFVYELLSGDETHDLYEFLELLVFVPIGIKNGKEV